MKKLIFLLFVVLTINTHAQLNKKWSATHSANGGTYHSFPAGIAYYKDVIGEWIYTASNEQFEPTLDSIRGSIVEWDSIGAIQWSITLTPAVSITTFPNGGIPGMAGDVSSGMLYVPYNQDPLASRLIKIDNAGNIVWNIVVNGVNNISSIAGGNSFLEIVGRSPQSNCGGFPCNGIAIARYDTTGQHLWTRVRYPSNFRTRPSDLTVDAAGNIIVCGKKAAILGSSGYNQTFVVKYAPDGTFLWQREFNATTAESTKQKIVVDGNNDVVFADGDGSAVKLRKLFGANGAVQWTKASNNSELTDVFTSSGSQDACGLATSTGMKCYSSTGSVLWSNSFIANDFPANSFIDSNDFPEDSFFDVLNEHITIATNVSQTEPLSNFLVQLDVGTGAVLLQKNLSVGYHEEYMGEYCGWTLSGNSNPGISLLINDTAPPYGTRVTTLAPCSAFMPTFSASGETVDVSNSTCNNGSFTAHWSSGFSSWPHIELWKGTSKIAEADPAVASPYEFQNLSAATYTLKVFDENCGEQSFDLTVRCPAPTGLSSGNITRNKARLNWSLPVCNSGVQLQYRLQGAVNWTTVTTTASYRQLTGLLPNSPYEWQIATKCGTGTPAVYSEFSALQIFNTAAQRLGVETSEEDPSLPDALTIFPNPASNQISISVGGYEGSAQLQVVNALGKHLLNQTVQMNGDEIYTLDISAFATGVYQIILTDDSGINTGKFVKD